MKEIAKTIPAQRIEDYFNDLLPAITDSIREIVEIESPSGSEAGSSAVADLICRMTADIGAGLSVERRKVSGVGEHVIIRAFPSAAKPILVLGHTDTVHPIGSKEKNPTRISGDRFFGCGIFDMKANIVLLIEILRFLTRQKKSPERPVTCIFSCDEEIGSQSGREIIEDEAKSAEFCLVFEPSSSGRVKTGRKGTALYTIRAKGIPAHAGLEPERGANAILEIAKQIEAVSRLNDPAAGTTVNVCTVRGGTATNVIPESAECTADVRFTTISAAKAIDAAIRNLKAFDPRVSLITDGGINRPPLERTAAVVGLYERARSLAATFGYNLGETQVGGASDGNFVAAIGVPVLDGLGVAGDGAHTLEEHIIVSDIAKRATLAALLLGGDAVC